MIPTYHQQSAEKGAIQSQAAQAVPQCLPLCLEDRKCQMHPGEKTLTMV